MSLPAFTQTNKLTDNTVTTMSSIIRAFNSLIVNLQQIFTALLKKPQLDSVILSSITLNKGLTVIPHTLNRNLTGWQIIRQSSIGTFESTGEASVWDAQGQGSNTNVNTYLYLMSSNSVIVSLLVF